MAKQIFSAHNLTKAYNEKVLFEQIGIGIMEGERIGIIGRNGIGKSTLLKLIAGLEEPDDGIVAISKDVRIEYLSQLPSFAHQQTCIEAVMEAKQHIIVMINRYDELCEIASNESMTDEQQEEMHDLALKIDNEQGWGLDTESKILLSKLGITDIHKDVMSLSGGQRKRVALARALLSEPDLLILDEPTNHLDADSVQWLQDRLQQSHKALLLVTHDRYFLDAISTRIIELDQKKLFSYDGNFEYYLMKKEARTEIEESTAEHERNKLRTELAWLQKGAKARRTKQKSRIDWIAKMQSEPKPEEQKQIKIEVGNRFLGGKLIDAVSISKLDKQDYLFKDFTYRAAPGDRIGVIGPNGAGKSTLLNVLSGRLKPDEGYVSIGDTVTIGYFDQEVKTLKENETLIANLREVAEYIDTGVGRERYLTAKDLLDRFLFPAKQHYSLVHTLSGGEKRRLAVLRTLMGNPNVLMFDEPTNDFDIQTLGALEEYLDSFKGILLIVSHDRSFLDRTVERIYSFEQNGKIKEYPGNYSAYLEKKEQADQKTTLISNKEVKTQAQNTTQTKKGLSFHEKNEYERLEKLIAEHEMKIKAMAKLLEDIPPHEYQKIAEQSEQMSCLEQESENNMMRWIELSDKQVKN